MFFFLSNSEQALLRFAACMLRGTFVWVTALSVKHHTKIRIFSFSGQAIARKMLS